MRLSTLLLTLFLSTTAFAQNHLRTSWSFVAGTVGEESVRAIETDAQGNIYVGGYFSGLIDFDPGPSTFNLQSNGSNADAFLLKLDPNGNFLWAKSFRGSNNELEIVYDIEIDSNGNVYATGIFDSNIQFVQGGSYFQGGASGTIPNFLVKFDSIGNYSWAHVWKGVATTDFVKIYDLETNPKGDVTIVGYFRGQIDFNPDTSQALRNAQNEDIFAVRLDSSGVFEKVVSIGGTGRDMAYSISIDQLGNNYVGGRFSNTVDFDPSADSVKVTNNGQSSSWDTDSYILKLNENLDYKWVKTFGGTGQTHIQKLIVKNAFVYSVGGFNSNTDFDPSSSNTSVISPIGSMDIFVHKIDSAGNFQWVNAIQAYLPVTPFDLALNSNGEIAVAGLATGPYFVFGTNNYPNYYSRNGNGGIDAIIATFNSSGNLITGNVFGSGSDDYAFATSWAQNGDLFLGGNYEGTMDIDPTAGVNQVTCSGADDMFLLRLSACATTDSVVATACDTFVTYAGKTITTSGWHGDTLTTSQGCDSVTYYDVTIHSTNFGLQLWQQGATLFSSVNNASGKQYQWIDCTTKQPIAGATDSAFSPAQNGTYALVVDDGNCTDTSTCLTTSGIGLAENSLPQVSLFPNPTTGLLHIKTAHKIKHIAIFDLTGRKVISIQKAENQLDISSLQSGVYLVEITTEQGSVVKRVVRE